VSQIAYQTVKLAMPLSQHAQLVRLDSLQTQLECA
jgi:hypothetical protein